MIKELTTSQKIKNYNYCRKEILLRQHPGMRAFVQYDGVRMEMPCAHQGENSCNFSIPPKALNAQKFIVYAVDRDGNKSKPKTLYTLERVVMEDPPN